MKRKWLLIILGIFIIVGGIFFFRWFDKQVRIDKCLDSGGRWNYELNQCEH